MYYLLFAFYLVAACFFITRISFIKNTGLGPKTILALFLLKIAAGILIGWMSQRFYPQGNDYWGLNGAGWKEYQMLMNDPKEFFADTFRSTYGDGYGGFFDSVGTFWNDLKNTLIGKFLAFCNIFSRGNYYINSLFLNFICFFGHAAFFRVFIDIYKNQKWPVLVGCFLLPSTLYFTAGIHKDLIVLTMLGLFCYSIYFAAKNGLTLKYLVTLTTSFIVLLFIRNFVALAIIPAAIAFVISHKKKWQPIWIFTSVYLLGFLLLLSMEFIKPAFQPLKIISQRQQDFLELPYAYSQLELRVLEPNVRSLVKNTPQALNHSLLRPYIWETQSSFLIPLAIELFCYQLIFILMIIWHKRSGLTVHPFILFGLFLSFSLLLFTGYIVPNTGSIVRYRSMYLPFLVTPVLCFIDWKRVLPTKHIRL